MTLLIVESIEESNLQKKFTLFGVDYYATRYAWLSAPIMLILGIFLALSIAPADETGAKILIGLGYGLLIIISGFLHGFGHIISSRMVGAPMSREIMTATVSITSYDDDGKELPSRVHFGRAIGGPLMNLILASMILLFENHFLEFFGYVHLVLFIATIAPIPSVDGAVIFRELLNWKS